MKFLGSKKLLALLLVAALCGCVVFGCQWYQAEHDRSDLERVCVYAASNANERFRNYLERSSEYDYHYAVSELTAFYDAHAVLTSDMSDSYDYMRLYTNQLLGELMDYPELTEEQIKDLINATALLKADIFDVNAYDDLFAVYNQLAR